MDETMDELHRAVRDLGAVGVQLFNNVGGRPIDHPDFEPVLAAMAEYDRRIRGNCSRDKTGCITTSGH